MVAKGATIRIVALEFRGAVAQWLEQGTHNPLVVGSSPTGPTNFFCHLSWADVFRIDSA